MKNKKLVLRLTQGLAALIAAGTLASCAVYTPPTYYSRAYYPSSCGWGSNCYSSGYGYNGYNNGYYNYNRGYSGYGYSRSYYGSYNASPFWW